MNDFVQVFLAVILIILFYFTIHGIRKFIENINIENEKLKTLLETVIVLSFILALPFFFFTIYGIKKFND